MKQVKLTNRTKTLMGIISTKANSTLDEQQMYQAEGDFAEIFGFFDGLLNTGKQVDTKTITDLYKMTQSMESGGTYDNMGDIARLFDTIKSIQTLCKQAQDYTVEFANKYGINI